MKKFHIDLKSRRDATRPRRAFTLVQLLIVVGIMALLSGVLYGVFGRGKDAARRAVCDTNLKAIALALDAYQQENGAYPKELSALQDAKFLRDAQSLRCSADPRVGEGNGYQDFYVMRAARDSSALPIVVCPFHEDQSATGMQAFKGRFTTQNKTKPVRVTAARNAMLYRPGKNPIQLAVGMELRGGDRIKTGGAGRMSNDGAATIEFADGSFAEFSSGFDATVLESFMMGSANAPLYTLIRQQLGRAFYRVHSGSKFDVTTPTATSSARGTAFNIVVKANGEGELVVEEGTVALTTLKQTIIAPNGRSVNALLGGLINIL